MASALGVVTDFEISAGPKEGDRRGRVIRTQDARRNRPPAQNSPRNRLAHRLSGARWGQSPPIHSVGFWVDSAMIPSSSQNPTLGTGVERPRWADSRPTRVAQGTAGIGRRPGIGRYGGSPHLRPKRASTALKFVLLGRLCCAQSGARSVHRLTARLHRLHGQAHSQRARSRRSLRRARASRRREAPS